MPVEHSKTDIALGFELFKDKCLRDVPAVGGIIKRFIAEAAHGGQGISQRGIYNNVSLLDINSLYPKALSILQIPTTKPLVWNTDVDLNDAVYFVVRIDITQHNYCWFIPYVKDGLRTVDKYELQFLVKYCNIKYDIKCGLYWCGSTVNVSEYINELYDVKRDAIDDDERKAAKLALNSLFGMTLKKGYRTRKMKRFATKTELTQYIQRRWGRVERFDMNKLEVVLNQCLDDTFNYAHIGTAILSMSKTLMYELFTECDSLNIPVYMSNVDSILIPTVDVPKLQHRIGNEIGMLKVEYSSKEAIVVRPNLHYLSNQHYRSSGIPHKTIEETGNIRAWFLDRLDQKQ
jgi:hypothetical protein